MKVVYNGHLANAGEPLFDAANQGFRYGDGLFETIKVQRGTVLLLPLHLQRLRKGMEVLGLHWSDDWASGLQEQVAQLCILNGCADAARVRIAVYRQHDDMPGYVVEAAPLEASAFSFNQTGWTIAVYPSVRKSVDILANHKTANYLLYILAARAARQMHVEECLVFNSHEAICDGSRTNIFIVKNQQLYTPALHQGCVAGVMRHHLIHHCQEQQIPVMETTISEQDLLDADEILLTNAIQGIRWVNQFAGRQYGNVLSRQLYASALATIYR